MFGAADGIKRYGSVSPTSSTPSLNQVNVGAGTPSLIQVRLTLSPSLTVVFAGGCMIMGIDGTTAVRREREREHRLFTLTLSLRVYVILLSL